MTILIVIHALLAFLWVGGMFFAHQILRPVAAQQLEPPQRLPLWQGVFKRFFVWVWLAVSAIPVTGYWMVYGYFGGWSGTGLHVVLMHYLGWLMIAIYAYVFFVPYKGLRNALTSKDFPAGGKELNKIRQAVGFNTILGLTVITIAVSGRFW